MGLRGVGKTVLLNRFAQVALGRDWVVVEHELTPKAELLGTLARLSRQALFEIEQPSAWKKAGRKIADLLRSMEIRYEITGLSAALPSADGPGAQASGDAAHDVTERWSLSVRSLQPTIARSPSSSTSCSSRTSSRSAR